MTNGMPTLLACIAVFLAPALLAQERYAQAGETDNVRGAAGADSGLTHEGRIREARARVESIRKTLENYRDNPQESDFRTIGGAVRLDSRGIRHSGVRRVPTEEFAARIERAEAQLKAAEEELKSLERSLY